MKYIRTLQNIKKLMDYAKSHVECYTDEYSGDCVDYKDDNFTIYTAIQDGDKMHVEIHTKSNGSATLYYEQDNSGEWELIKDYITDIDDIVNVNKALRKSAKEIKEMTYQPLTATHAIDKIVEFSEDVAKEKEDDRIAEPFRKARKIITDNLDDASYRADLGVYFFSYFVGKNRITVFAGLSFTDVTFEVNGEEYSIRIDGRDATTCGVSLIGDESLMDFFDAGDDAPADDTDKLDTIKEMQEITDSMDQQDIQAVFNRFYDYILDNIGNTKTLYNEASSTLWLIVDGDIKIVAGFDFTRKAVTVGCIETQDNISITYDKHNLRMMGTGDILKKAEILIRGVKKEADAA